MFERARYFLLLRIRHPHFDNPVIRGVTVGWKHSRYEAGLFGLVLI